MVASLLTAARRHFDAASSIAAADPDGAYALAYDGARKAATAVLAQQGLRVAPMGGHLVLVEVIEAQFPDHAGMELLDRLRLRRNQVEYPDSEQVRPITAAEVAAAIAVAGDCIESATRLVEAPELDVF